jgi:hypothetical protein
VSTIDIRGQFLEVFEVNVSGRKRGDRGANNTYYPSIAM